MNARIRPSIVVYYQKVNLLFVDALCIIDLMHLATIMLGL